MLQIIFKQAIILLFLNALFINPQSVGSEALVNTSHLDFLFEQININGKEMGIIHIYSNYPDYKWTGDEDEGIACVDDAARASVFYLKHYLLTADKASLLKNKQLINFLRYMQTENGFFCNFIREDHSINKDFRTSVAEPDWWSWRALWALTEAHQFYKENDPPFARKISYSVGGFISALKKIIPGKYELKEISGFKKPSWLPSETASDQAAILLLGLTAYYKETNDTVILDYCKKLAEGILLMQEGDTANFPHYAFLSWENLWHGWGNLQSYSLLGFYEVINDELILNAALNEIDHFYSYLFPGNFCSEFSLKKENGKTVPASIREYPQIAYAIRPMVYASLKAFEITKDSMYAEKAAYIASWFFGNNSADEQMYFPENGKCFDGIPDKQNLNRNSGAESTIEALLTMIEFDKNSYLKMLFGKYDEVLINAD